MSATRMHTAISQVGQFSDDGQWWWDGTAWIATPQVVIPDVGIPQSENLQRLMRERWRAVDTANVAQAASLGELSEAGPAAFVLGMSALFSERDAFRELREWSLEQLAAATTVLLGTEEPMVAAETSLYRPRAALGFVYSNAVSRDVGIVVTTTHVLLLGFDRFDGQPRSVLLAARARDVRVEAPTPIFTQPTILVRRGPTTWWVQGTVGVLQPKPVVAAWRAAVATPAGA